MKKLNYKGMILDILPYVEDEFCAEMEMKTLPKSSPYTQKESQSMAERLAKIYSIAHCEHCTACQKKYM